MDAGEKVEKKQAVPSSEHTDAPPALPGQAQPWTQWYEPEDLQNANHDSDDDNKNTCKNRTRAVTSI
ncbi:hypothetical protein SPI_09137 [Niveomyces insectorum RCEF 264]|uniref:Uncharacterized protein n=1 Tax=Niveomyces insectorum RCEF 264 TaxID=1081102 RepID=A0A162MBR0_9HYPO|nr:hypothetical protein SPI_09137 [Niveomyces insectorum RCEF 264]